MLTKGNVQPKVRCRKDDKKFLKETFDKDKHQSRE